MAATSSGADRAVGGMSGPAFPRSLCDRATDVVAGLVAEDFVDHGAPPWAPQGRAGYLQIVRFLTGVLQLRYEVHDIVADGDRVAVRATAHGVHNTDHLGFAATGRPYAMPTMHLYRAAGSPRAEQVRTTRQRVLGAARDLFLRRGFAGATIEAVAHRAGVSPQTVYNVVGGKAALLKAVYDVALAGDDEPVPMIERPIARALPATEDLSRAETWLAGTMTDALLGPLSGSRGKPD